MKGLFLLIVIACLGIGYLLIYSPVFKVKTITFSGEEPNCTNKEEIIKISGILGENVLFLDKLKPEKIIKDKFLCIRSVTAQKSIPDRMRLELKNRRALLTLLPSVPNDSTESAEQSSSVSKPKQISLGLLIDDEGVIFAVDEGQSNQPAVFVLGEELSVGKKLDQGLIQKSVQVLEKIKSLGVNSDDPKIYSNINLSLGQKPQMVFLLNEKIDRQLASLQLILDQAKMDTKEVEFLDLRFDKPIVRYAPKKN